MSETLDSIWKKNRDTYRSTSEASLSGAEAQGLPVPGSEVYYSSV